MALCAYHEDTESVATCVVCKSEICGKCQEFGSEGMCGMCLEMSNARKATADASRQARAAAAPAGQIAPGRSAPQAAQPARSPAKGTTGSVSKQVATGQKPAGAGGKPPGAGARPGGTAPKAPPPGSKPASKAGFCVEHDGQQLTALCTNCRKKVCPYCLDLYDLCVTCRALPHCSRHESMVSAAKCESCNLDYCRLCLDDTPFCDRCRTLGMARVSAAKQGPRGGTGKLDGAKPSVKQSTAAAEPQAPPHGGGAPPARKVPLTPPKPGQPGYRPPGKAVPLMAPAKKRSGPPALVYIVSGLLLFGVAAYVLFADSRPRLSPEEANAALRKEMAMVQAAAAAVQERTGRQPDTIDQVMDQLKAQGVDLKKVNPPLKLVLNGPGAEPLTIMLMGSANGMDIRALDAEGRPLTENGRDIILRVAPPGESVPADRGARDATSSEAGVQPDEGGGD